MSPTNTSANVTKQAIGDEPILPQMPAPLFRHPKLGEMFDRMQMHCYAAKHAEGLARLLDAAGYKPPAIEVVDKRRCKKCNATRGGTNCWKCGTETFQPDPRCGDDPALPPLDRIRELAKEVGYAIGVHGSQQRDLDVIAAPWSDDAVGNHALMEHIAQGLITENGPARIIEVERKPLGRYAATIQMDGWYKNLDISVCPRVAPQSAEGNDSIEALTALRHWFETQHKLISKGCGSSWDMGQCDEQIALIDGALVASAPSRVGNSKEQ